MTDLTTLKADKTNLIAFPRIRRQPDASVMVVIPCYNEANRLDAVAFGDYLEKTPSVSFVFVNDGSRDNTLECLSDIHEMFPDRVHVLSLHRNSGKAEAVRQGLSYACETSATFVGYWDADLATPLDAIDDFARIGARLSEVEVIFGSRRMMLGHRVARTAARRAVSRICASLARLALCLPIGDTQCGAKLMRNTEALSEALSQPFSAGWLFDVELFTRLSARIENRDKAFYEYPLAEWTEIAGSKVSGKAILRSGFSMLRLIAETRLGLTRKALAVEPTGMDVVCAAWTPATMARAA